VRNALEVIYVGIAELTPYARNARVHNKKQGRKLDSLLRRYGQVAPILVDDNNVIVDGHAVYDAMKSLGEAQIAAVVVANRDPAEIRALRLALNRVAQDSAWDQDLLRDELKELLELGFDLELSGFDSVEIDMALAIDEPAGDAVEAELEADLEPPGEPYVSRGDLFQLGQHLVACGDARDAALLQGLLGERKATVVFTDPPYNVKVDGFISGLGRTRHAEFAMAAGEMTREAFITFLSEAIAAVQPCLGDGAILFAAIDWRHALELQLAAERQGLEHKNTCIWVKTNGGMGTFYRSRHEFFLVFKAGDRPHQNHFELGQHGRTRTNVWEYAGMNTFAKSRMDLLQAHPTVKPTSLIADALRDVSRRGDVVIDPFLGSGSTLIAAEEVGRACVGVELEPGYVEVAIRRWQKRTGRDAVNIKTGETFDDFIAQKRAAMGERIGRGDASEAYDNTGTACD
jgi:DNA modification methylase